MSQLKTETLLRRVSRYICVYICIDNFSFEEFRLTSGTKC